MGESGDEWDEEEGSASGLNRLRLNGGGGGGGGGRRQGPDTPEIRVRYKIIHNRTQTVSLRVLQNLRSSWRLHVL